MADKAKLNLIGSKIIEVIIQITKIKQAAASEDKIVQPAKLSPLQVNKVKNRAKKRPAQKMKRYTIFIIVAINNSNNITPVNI